MLAEDIIEDSLLCFMTREAPNVDTDGVPLSHMASVIRLEGILIYILHIMVFTFLIPWRVCSSSIFCI
jgi:hypothetical protein